MQDEEIEHSWKIPPIWIVV